MVTKFRGFAVKNEARFHKVCDIHNSEADTVYLDHLLGAIPLLTFVHKYEVKLTKPKLTS